MEDGYTTGGAVLGLQPFGDQPAQAVTVRDLVAIQVLPTLLGLLAGSECPPDRAPSLAARAAYDAADALIEARGK